MTQFDKMKLTKFGCYLNLQKFSFCLSVFGIVFSIIGIIGGYSAFVKGFLSGRKSVIYYITGAVILTISMPYLAMWILFKIKTSKKDIPCIEKIGKVYCYMSGSVEIIGMIVYIGMETLSPRILYWNGNLVTWKLFINRWGIVEILQSCCAAVYLIYACLKIYLIKVQKTKLLGIYLGFRYALFFIYMTDIVIFGQTYTHSDILILSIIGFIGSIPYFILDLGLTVILHSIRVDREKTARIENPLNVKLI